MIISVNKKDIEVDDNITIESMLSVSTYHHCANGDKIFLPLPIILCRV